MSTRQRIAPGLPISERHAEVLAEMTVGEIVGASTLRHRLDLAHGSVVSALYALQDRGLVERVPYRGWRRLK